MVESITVIVSVCEVGRLVTRGIGHGSRGNGDSGLRHGVVVVGGDGRICSIGPCCSFHVMSIKIGN